MKHLMIILILGLSACAQNQALDHENGLNSANKLGPWEAQYSLIAGVSVKVPCKTTNLVSDPQDGYGHPTKQYEMSCKKELPGSGSAFFSLSRTIFPSDPTLAEQDFEKYMAFVRSQSKQGFSVRFAGQRRELHMDYELKQQSVRGDLGFHQLQDSCMWNFMGLDGVSEVQDVMILPLRMCPTDEKTIKGGIASTFFDSIKYDVW